ncbi:hypothetical protein [Lysobacter terrae]
MNPHAHHMAAALPRLADMLSDQLYELYKDLSPDRCDRMAVELAGAQAHIRRLCSELLRGDPPTV